MPIPVRSDSARRPEPSSSIPPADHNGPTRVPRLDSTAPATMDRARSIQMKPPKSRSRQTSPTKTAPAQAKPSPALEKAPPTRRASQVRPASSDGPPKTAAAVAAAAAGVLRAKASPAAPPSSFKAPPPPTRTATLPRSRPTSSQGPSSFRPPSSHSSAARPASSSGPSAKPASRPNSATNSYAKPITRSQSTRGAHARAASAVEPSPTLPPSTKPTPAVAKPTPGHRRGVSSSSSAPKATPSKTGPNTTPATPRDPGLKRRPAFNADRQHFSPARPAALPTPSISGVDFRKQQHILHLQLLHDSFNPTYNTWLSSAKAQLHDRHKAMVESYHQNLVLGRLARQQRNLLALTRWTSGNAISLARKLTALCAVLDIVADLTHPGGPSDNGPDIEPGEYMSVVFAFAAWVSWVLSIWEDRDQALAAGDLSLGEEAGRFRQIEGLGDAVNNSIKGLVAKLRSLSMRMEEVGTFPELHLPGEDVETTPAQLVHLTQALVAGMSEEVQVMREIEAEAVIGEKAWMEERVRRMDQIMAEGLGTSSPVRGGTGDAVGVFSPGYIGA